MKKNAFTLWCIQATGKIRYTPDRAAVHAELCAHLEDHRDALLAQGLTEEEATRKALEAMGDPEQIAPQLAAIHRPFWGYFLRVNLIVMAVLAVLCIWPLWGYLSDVPWNARPNLRDFDVYSSASYGSDTGRTLHHLSQPEVSLRTDGSTFTATDVAVFTEITSGNGTAHTRLYVLIRQTGLLPCKEHDQYFRFESICNTFRIQDSLGNAYGNDLRQSGNDLYSLNAVCKQSGIFTCTHEVWINDFPANAQWLEISYERDGRSCSMHIYLTGGTQQ